MRFSIRGYAMNDEGISGRNWHQQLLERLRRSKISRRLRYHRLFMTGLILFTLVLIMAIFAALLAPHLPNQNNFRYRLGAPNHIFLLGTDGFGRDVLSRVIYGTRVSLRIGVMVVVMTGVLGTLIGAVAGSVRVLDNVIMRVMDGLMAFPAILLAIALAATLGASETNVVIALTIAYTPRTARIVRASVLVVRELEYVQAACDALGTDNVDVVLLNRAPIVLRHEVFREGKPLLVRDPEALARFRLESSREFLDTIPLRRMFEEAFFHRVRRDGFARQASRR